MGQNTDFSSVFSSTGSGLSQCKTPSNVDE